MSFERAAAVLAGGVDSPVRAGKAVGAPTPMIVSAAGSKVRAADGAVYIDFLCAYGPVFLGHADPGIAAAVREALERGSVFGSTHPEEVRLAERIRSLMPSMRRVRFVNSGTEAVMSAVRVARAFTLRETLIRFEGNYHGHSDEVIHAAGASSDSRATLECGVTQAVRANTIVLPYNELAALDATLRRQRGAVAAVLLEPIVANMGLVRPAEGYLEGVRALCDRDNALLIFDEVITGFRLGPGGAQERLHVTPDLTCLGKALGGGLPIAAFGGRADVMSVLAPTGAVFQGGTFSGNPVCVAAAHAFLDALEREPEIYQHVDRIARRLAEGAASVLRAAGLPYPVVQVGSIVDFMFRAGPPHRNYAQAREADAEAYAGYYRAMLERGILLPPSPLEVMFVTAAHTESDVDAALAAMQSSLHP